MKRRLVKKAQKFESDLENKGVSNFDLENKGVMGLILKMKELSDIRVPQRSVATFLEAYPSGAKAPLIVSHFGTTKVVP